MFTGAVTARGYTAAEAIGYGVGYAPASWTGLVDHLREQGDPALTANRKIRGSASRQTNLRRLCHYGAPNRRQPTDIHWHSTQRYRSPRR